MKSDLKGQVTVTADKPSTTRVSQTLPQGGLTDVAEAVGKHMTNVPIKELRDSEARYRRLFETAQDGILLLDAATGQITDVNPFLIKLLGYSHAEFLTMALWDIGLFKDKDASKAAFDEVQTSGYVRYEDLPLKPKDGGKQIRVEVVSNLYRVNGERVMQCNIRDITQRAKALQSEQLKLQGQKMEAVGQLAGGLAHDFNNLLGVILGYCEALEEKTDLTGSSRQMLDEIRNAGTSARNMTQRLLAFSRRQVLQPVLLDINQSVRNMQSMLSRLVGENFDLESKLADDVGTIMADPSQIELVIMNLVINARDAMPNGGRIYVETRNVDVNEVDMLRPEVKQGFYVELTVCDTGIGMDAETQSHLFEPFFSTKPPGQGTGLGLSTAFGIVKQSGGSINVSSELGYGTTFRVLIPRSSGAPIVQADVKAKSMVRGTETILLVDDMTSLRLLIRKLLEGVGYTVIDSGDPTEALRIATTHTGELSLMITDMVMPSFSGSVLADMVVAARPKTKVLFMSGYPGETFAKSLVPNEDYAFLSKPFTRKELLNKVREVLDRGAQPADVLN